MSKNLSKERFRIESVEWDCRYIGKKSIAGRVGGLMPNQCFTLPRTISDLNMFLWLINGPMRGQRGVQINQ